MLDKSQVKKGPKKIVSIVTKDGRVVVFKARQKKHKPVPPQLKPFVFKKSK
jgi:hypothetical protein